MEKNAKTVSRAKSSHIKNCQGDYRNIHSAKVTAPFQVRHAKSTHPVRIIGHKLKWSDILLASYLDHNYFQKGEKIRPGIHVLRMPGISGYCMLPFMYGL